MEINKYSEPLPQRLWGEENYFFKFLTPRISQTATRANDAAVQAQIDVFGHISLGTIKGSLSPVGSFAALLFPGSLPERLVTMAYLEELESFFEAFEMEIAETVCDSSFVDKVKESRVGLMAPKDTAFNNPGWQTNFKKALAKAQDVAVSQDARLGPSLETGLKNLVLTPYLGPRMEVYTSVDDFLVDRVVDIAWLHVSTECEFAANLTLTPEDRSLVGDTFWPLWAHAACIHDIFTWDWEQHMSVTRGAVAINAVPLLQRLHGLSVEAAKDWLRDRCFGFESEYLRRRQALLEGSFPGGEAPVTLRRLCEAQEAIATGFNVWCPQAYRHDLSSKGAYQDYYTKRLSQGAKWFDNVTESQELLPGQ